MGNNTCCCTTRNQDLLQQNQGYKDDRLMTVLGEKLSGLKKRISTQFRGNTYSTNRMTVDNDMTDSLFVKGRDRFLLESIDEGIDSYYDEGRRTHKMLASVSSLTGRSRLEDMDEYEMLVPGSIFQNGNFLLVTCGQFTPNQKEQSYRGMFIHSKIYEKYSGEQQKLVELVGLNQTVVMQSLISDEFLATLMKLDDVILEDKVIDMLRLSKNYKDVSQISKYYETSNAIVYKILQPGYAGLTIKVPKEQNMVNSLSRLSEDLIYDSQLQKFLNNPDYVNVIKEEVVKINALDQTLGGYVVIQEEPLLSLHDLQFQDKTFDTLSKGLWHKESADKSEHFSLPKYLYYLYKTLECMQFYHDQGIIIGGITAIDILIDQQTQKVKFRTLAHSIMTKTDDLYSLPASINNTNTLQNGPDVTNIEDDYDLKHINTNYCCPAIIDQFYENYKRDLIMNPLQEVILKYIKEITWSEDVLIDNDRYGIAQSFAFGNIENLLQQRSPTFVKQFFEQIHSQMMSPQKEVPTREILQSFRSFFVEHFKIVQYLINQMNQENKIPAAIDVCTHAIDGLNEGAAAPAEGYVVQYQLAQIYIKRAKLRRLLSKFKGATKDVKQALLIYSMHFQSKHNENADLMLDLVELLIEQQDYNDSLLKLKSASKIVIDNDLLSDVKLANRLYTLHGKLYGLRDELDKSFGFYEEVSQLTVTSLGDQAEPHYLLAESMRNVASSLKAKGNYEKSKEKLKEYLDLVIILYGPDSLQHGYYHLDLGQISQEQGQVDKAILSYTKYLEVHKQHFSENTAQRANVYSILGIAFLQKKFYHRSLQYHSKALEIKLQTLGDNDLSTASSYNHLGLLYKQQGQFERALDYFIKDLSIQRQINGENHPSLSAAYNNLGTVHKSLCLYDDAIQSFEKCLALKMKSVKTPDHQLSVAATLNNLGLSYKGKGDYFKAVKYYKDSLKIKKALLEKNHLSIATSYANLASSCLMLEKHDEALEFTQLEREIMTNLHGPDDVSVAFCLQRMGAIYYGIGNLDQALDGLYTARNILRQINSVKGTTGQRELLQKVEHLIVECGGNLNLPMLTQSSNIINGIEDKTQANTKEAIRQ